MFVDVRDGNPIAVGVHTHLEVMEWIWGFHLGEDEKVWISSCFDSSHQLKFEYHEWRLRVSLIRTSQLGYPSTHQWVDPRRWPRF